MLIKRTCAQIRRRAARLLGRKEGRKIGKEGVYWLTGREGSGLLVDIKGRGGVYWLTGREGRGMLVGRKGRKGFIS